ncbi:MAG: type III secretion system chaperone [Myxococcota bacterium]
MSQRFLSIMRKIAETDAVLGYYKKDDSSVFFEVRTGDGRSQVVMANLSEGNDNEKVVHMMSEVGPADPALYEDMLMRNLNLRYSRIAVLDANGEKTFALVYSYPLEELEPVELARAFGEIAFMADGIERECFAVDRM